MKRKHTGKMHQPHHLKGEGKSHAHHSHAKHNRSHGLPADAFGHGTKGYKNAGGGFCGKGNC